MTCILWLCALQRIDMERASREALDPSLRHKPRLISAEELPSWLMKDVEEVCTCGGGMGREKGV